MTESSSVYGPVNSWRVGRSLGVDLLCVNSICSFRCVYCQLGRINLHTTERRVYVPTARVMRDLRRSAWRAADIITFSGSGEPTLAANLGEVIRRIKDYTAKPVLVLTNGAHLHDAAVRRALSAADKVFCKLDAADERTFRQINRPAAGVTLRTVIAGIKKFRAEYRGHLAIQTMFMPANARQAERLAPLLCELRPDELQLNAPTRPCARTWTRAARGNAPPGASTGVRLRQLAPAEAARVEDVLHRLTGLKIVSAYNR